MRMCANTNEYTCTAGTGTGTGTHTYTDTETETETGSTSATEAYIRFIDFDRCTQLADWLAGWLLSNEN